MNEISELRCGICHAAMRPDAKFCVACGNPVASEGGDGPAPAQQHCTTCGEALPSGQPFCSCCGARSTVGTEETSPSAVADAVMEALKAILAPQGVLVLVERPGSKRPRRCEVSADGAGSISEADRQRIAPLLEEALIWDGYLCALVGTEGSSDAHCVWHVLDADLFPLSADHAESLLFYHEGLRPDHWSDDEDVIGAPKLALDRR